MNNKKAFTLVELLAIIVILGIVLAVAIPRIVNSIKNTQKKSLLATTEALVRKVKQKSVLEDMSNEVYTITNNVFVGNSLNITGELPNSGKISIDDQNRISIAVTDGKFCALKTYEDEDITVNEDVLNCNLNTLIDMISPIVTEAYSGNMFYTDPNFSIGTNNMNVYNNMGNGTVTHARIALSTPVGSYAMRIITNGAATPGLGGYYQGTMSRANAIFIHRIIAKIPVGYTINRTSNAVGNTPQIYWLTTTAGTGDWKEYIYIIKTSATGTFSSFGHIYLTGTSPVTWYVAYSTIIDTQRVGTNTSIIFKATDVGTGIAYYGINQSSTSPPAYTPLTTSNTIAMGVPGFTTNGTYYIWVKDGAGNISNMPIPITMIP